MLDVQAFAHALSQAERRVTAELAAALAADGVSVEQWRILVALADGEGHPMAELADFALVPPPTLTRLVDRMVADNLAYRVADPRDRRRVLLRVTARGRRLHGRLAQRVQERADAILAAADAAGLARLAALRHVESA